MPMFDDPRKELRRLEEQLRAEEEYDDDLEGIEKLLEDYEEEDFSACFREEEEDDEAFRRPGDYTRTMSEILLEEESEVTDSKPEKKRKKKKGNGIVGLAVICFLEAAAIVGLLAWWYLCLR